MKSIENNFQNVQLVITHDSLSKEGTYELYFEGKEAIKMLLNQALFYFTLNNKCYTTSRKIKHNYDSTYNITFKYKFECGEEKRKSKYEFKNVPLSDWEVLNGIIEGGM